MVNFKIIGKSNTKLLIEHIVFLHHNENICIAVCADCVGDTISSSPKSALLAAEQTTWDNWNGAKPRITASPIVAHMRQ